MDLAPTGVEGASKSSATGGFLLCMLVFMVILDAISLSQGGI
jgi:hypothetical protein